MSPQEEKTVFTIALFASIIALLALFIVVPYQCGQIGIQSGGEYTCDELRQKRHRSLLRNTLLVQVFYYGELLEKWGTRTSRMITLCQNHGIPKPEFSSHPDWFSVTFDKNFYTDERLLALGLSDWQVQAVRYVREQGVITNKVYRELTGAIDRTALRDLNDLDTRRIFSK
jgi:ATP-dependent DNA helicase RecG